MSDLQLDILVEMIYKKIAELDSIKSECDIKKDLYKYAHASGTIKGLIETLVMMDLVEKNKRFRKQIKEITESLMNLKLREQRLLKFWNMRGMNGIPMVFNAY